MFWMTIEGADLCKKSVPEKIVSPIFSKFGNAMEIMDRVRKNGCKFGVCPPCAEYFSAKGDEKFDWVELQGGDWLMKNIQDSWVVWFSKRLKRRAGRASSDRPIVVRRSRTGGVNAE
jgi:predicted peroxiredoxin